MSFLQSPNNPSPLPFKSVLDYGAKGDGSTDDTGAIQAAVNAVSTLAQTRSFGIGDLLFPSGFGFKFGQIILKSGVRCWCYGSTMIPINAGITNIGWFGQTGAGAGLINRWEMRGGTFLGAGNETFGIYSQPNFGALTDGLFKDMMVSNWGLGPIAIPGASRCRILDNTMIGLPATNNNSVNLITGNTDPQSTNFIIIRGNIILSAATAAQNGGGAIAIVENTATLPPSAPAFLTIDGNICSGPSTNAGTINLENDFAGSIFNRILVTRNHATALRLAGSASQAVVVEGAFQDVLVDGNTLKGNNLGINLFAGAGTSITNNRIDSVSTPIGPAVPQLASSNRFSALGAMSGRATLVAGTVTVNTAEIIAGDNVILTVVVPGGTRGEIQLGTIVAGTSFVINSIQPGTASTIQGADTSTVYWRIDH